MLRNRGRDHYCWRSPSKLPVPDAHPTVGARRACANSPGGDDLTWACATVVRLTLWLTLRSQVSREDCARDPTVAVTRARPACRPVCATAQCPAPHSPPHPLVCIRSGKFLLETSYKFANFLRCGKFPLLMHTNECAFAHRYRHSTVTLFARLRGLSTSVPRAHAV